MNQEIKSINLKDLVLWTENPRDPIDENATDQDIVDKALSDDLSKWNLDKLAKEMGSYYDFSELPTVVYHEGKPVVYDGNRRIILGKIKHGIVNISGEVELNIPDFPEKIPCNTCSKKIALKNILRKHGDTGSWLPLERDIFLHKHMNEEKSPFLILEECTGLISSKPYLNQRFVKEEIFKEEVLKKMGFDIVEDQLHSVYDENQAHSIFSDISKKIKDKKITTRKNRGKVLEILEPSQQEIIEDNKRSKMRPLKVIFAGEGEKQNKPKQSRRTKKKINNLFGGKLYLRMGEVSNLYRDISDLYIFYTENKNRLSQSFTSLIRMSLRLLCEAAAKDDSGSIDKYIRDYFDKAKRGLDADIKTTLSNHNVKKNSIVQLLHTGAHNYQAAANLEQTIAVSVILGSILTITHGQDTNK